MRKPWKLASAVACGVALVGFLSGCDRQVEVSAELRESIAQLGDLEEIATLTDLRELEEPSPELRDHLASSGDVYRVIESSRDRALLAFWRKAGLPPVGLFDKDPVVSSTEDIVVASACASLERRGEAVVSGPTDCPYPVATWQPSADSQRWTRGASATETIQLSVYTLESDLRWTISRNSDGAQPGSERVDLAVVVDAIEAASLTGVDAEAEVEIVAITQVGDSISGRLRLTASAPEDVNTDERATTAACFDLDVDPAVARHAGVWKPLISVEC